MWLPRFFTSSILLGDAGLLGRRKRRIHGILRTPLWARAGAVQNVHFACGSHKVRIPGRECARSRRDTNVHVTHVSKV